MDPQIVIAVINVLPQSVLVLLLAAVGIRYRQPLTKLLAKRVAAVTFFGVKVELNATDVAEAVVAKAPGDALSKGIAADADAAGRSVATRAARLAPRLAGRIVLWVDDHPEYNRIERRLLREMGVFVEPAITNHDALQTLDDGGERIDVVVSDIGRDDGTSGLDLPGEMAARRHMQPVIFYVADLRPDIPPGARGITNRPDELLHMIMDALDRIEGDSAESL